MKKLTLTLIILSSMSIAFSQDRIAKFGMGYLSDHYSIWATEPNEYDNYKLIIETEPQDRFAGDVILIVKSSKLEKFINIIQNASLVYTEWKQTAIENNVTELNKEIDIKRIKLYAKFRFASDNYYDFNVCLKARFVVMNERYRLIISNIYNLQASSNQYIDNKGFFLEFHSKEQINDFILKISPDNINHYYQEKRQKEKIFKQ
ncbi:MAG: hypothetical protein K8S00_12105 [Bacteroidales bacterium]|nr:hypothetical protein [Bacteroidales bacterium]